MTMAGDIVVSSILTIFAIIIHRISAELFNQQTALYGIATEGTEVFHGPERAAFIADVLIIWVPMLIIGFAWTWAALKAYKRQTMTARQQVRR